MGSNLRKSKIDLQTAALLWRNTTAKWLRDRKNGAQAPLNICLSRRPGRDADPHCPPSVPHRAAAPTGSLCLNCVDDRCSRFVVAESDKNLIQHHVVQHLVSSRS